MSIIHEPIARIQPRDPDHLPQGPGEEWEDDEEELEPEPDPDEEVEPLPT